MANSIIGESEAVLAPDAPKWQRSAHRLVNGAAFQWVVVAVIVFNAAILGLQTYDDLPGPIHRLIEPLDGLCLAFFVVEVLIRMASYRFNLRQFFKDPWNIFDVIVIGLGYLPWLRANPTALRMVRLARIARIARIMPDFRVLMSGLRIAAPPALSLLALTALLCYLYAVVGFMLFGRVAPQYFGNLGEGMLTLFTLLTLEGWNSVLYDLREVSPWALPYVISFLLIGTYVVINLVIGIVINSLERAYQDRDREAAHDVELADTINELQSVIGRLERKLADLDQKRRPDRHG